MIDGILILLAFASGRKWGKSLKAQLALIPLTSVEVFVPVIYVLWLISVLQEFLMPHLHSPQQLSLGIASESWRLTEMTEPGA